MVAVLSRRPAVRDVLFSALFALWCVAWPAGLVLLVDSAPAFVALLDDFAARKAIEFFSPLSYRLTLCALGGIVFAAMWLLLSLRRWLDPQAQAVQALRWTFSSRSFNATVLFAVMVVTGLLMAGFSAESLALSLPAFPDAGRFFVAWWFPIALATPVVILILAFFLLFNPDTLARNRLERWWRPFWPGLPALVVGVVGWVLVPAVMAQAKAPMFFVIPAADWMPAGAIDIIGYAIELLCDLLVFAFLFSRRSVPGLREALRRLFRWSTVRAHIGLDVLVLGWMLVIAVPLLSVGVFDAYVLPSFEAWRQESGDGAPTLLATWADVLSSLRGFETPPLLLVMPLDLWLQFVLGRLLYRTAFAVPAGEAPFPER
jgi:hypothetical protein